MHIIFGTGPLGQAVAASLHHRGHPVRLVNRSGQAPEGFDDLETVAGDLTRPPAARKAAQGASVVYHCAVTPYTDWPETLPALMDGAIDVAAAEGARLVYGDNLYAYVPTSDPFTEETPERPTTRKGRVRKDVADTLRSAHAEGRVKATIGRASDFYGPGVTNSVVGDQVFGRLVEGKAPRVLGDPDQLHTFSYIEDVGRALVVLATHDEAFGETWHLPNAPAVMTRTFAEEAATAMSQPVRIKTAPSWLLRALGYVSPTMREVSEMLYQWEDPFVVDHSKFEREFGADFGDVTPLKEGISRTAAAFKEDMGP